jgi:hypothetical protein
MKSDVRERVAVAIARGGPGTASADMR